MSIPTDELTARYRNLLIILAREIIRNRDQCEHVKVRRAVHPGAVAGRNCQAKVISAHRRRLTTMLLRNRAAMIHYFGTDDIELVADRSIVLS